MNEKSPHSPIYDPCYKWIKTMRKTGQSWHEVYMAGTSAIEARKKFFVDQKAFWPLIDQETMLRLVCRAMLEEGEIGHSFHVDLPNNAALDILSENNDLSIFHYSKAGHEQIVSLDADHKDGPQLLVYQLGGKEEPVVKVGL